jgi:tetratricopeptide (TPR) repeat protein
MAGWLSAALCGCAVSSDRVQAPVIAPVHDSATAPPWVHEQPHSQQATSLLGEALYSPEIAPEVRARREQDLYEAQIAYDRAVHDESAIIWLGRRQAYLGEYRAAIDTFSNGLAILPGSFRLLRHRGHRYITLREFDRAIADLSRAATLIELVPDEVEPDGQPNAQNVPTSTLHTNVFYHLGLAHYLKGEWREAARWYQRCLDAAGNDDMRVAAMYWLYLSLMRGDRTSEADALLQHVSPVMNVVENGSYHRLLLMFAGDLSQMPQPVAGAANDVTIDIGTIAYGLGAWELLRGNAEAAQRAFHEAIAKSNWAAFGHIAAEAELARQR